MTTEEIEKAIERFTEERRHKSTGYPPKEWFKAGAEFADKHWQEKTRWIPVEKKLPEVRDTPYCIAIKYKVAESDCDNIGAICIYDKTDVDYILLEQITHWREIEL